MVLYGATQYKQFASWVAVREFAGEDCAAAVVPAKAGKVLAHFDARSTTLCSQGGEKQGG